MWRLSGRSSWVLLPTLPGSRQSLTLRSGFFFRQAAPGSARTASHTRRATCHVKGMRYSVLDQDSSTFTDVDPFVQLPPGCFGTAQILDWLPSLVFSRGAPAWVLF